jgi:hypothetical protein
MRIDFTPDAELLAALLEVHVRFKEQELFP